MRRRGEITVFLALMFSILSVFILLLAQTIRIYISKSEAVYAVDNAVRSCFAEYNRELFRRFHILLIDSSYKGNENGREFTEGRFCTYLESSLANNEICRAGITGCKSAGGSEGYLFDAAVAYAKEELCLDPRLSVTGDTACFLTYLMSVCGNDEIPNRPSIRKGEIEYLLYGYESDDENIMWAHTDHKAGAVEDGEIPYEDYLCARLEKEDKDTVLIRFSELVTEYMRENGSPGFDLDECYYAASFAARLQGVSGESYSVERDYAYIDENT